VDGSIRRIRTGLSVLKNATSVRAWQFILPTQYYGFQPVDGIIRGSGQAKLVSALYFVPFLVFQYFLKRPRVGPLVLICPILYTIHALLIVAGVPIFFTGNWGIWNMFLPVFGYTFLTYVICHVYSRYALKKLKGLTHLEGEEGNEA